MVRAFDAANGVKFSAPERMMWTGGLVIDKTNVDAYRAKFYGEKLDIDFTKMSKFLHPDDWDPGNVLTPIDMDKMWEGQKKPSGFAYPAPYKAAKDSGEFDRVAQEYKARVKNPIFS